MGKTNAIIKASLGVVVTLWLAQAAAYAQTAPVVKASKIRDFGRISFEWPRETRLKAGSNGKQLQIVFEQSAKVDSAAILRGLAPYVTNVAQSADGKSLTLTTNEAYQIRSFVSNNVNGIDILRLGETPTQVAVKAPEPKAAPKIEPKPAPTPAPAPKKPEPAKAPEKVAEKAVEKVVEKPAPPKPTPAPVVAPIATATAASSAPKELMKAEAPEVAEAVAKPTVEAPTPAPAPAAIPALELKPDFVAAPRVALAETPSAEAATTPAALAESLAKAAQEKPQERPEEVQTAVAEVVEAAAPAPTTSSSSSSAETSSAPSAEALAAAAETESSAESSRSSEESSAPNPIDAIAEEDIPAADAPLPELAAQEGPELPEVTVPGGSVKAEVASANNQITLNFPFSQRVASTAFRRGNRDYIYFSQPLEIDIATIRGVEGIDSVESTPLGNGVLITIQTAKPGLIADKEKDGYAWNFMLSTLPTPPRQGIRAIPQTEPPLKPHILLQALELLDGVPFEDPLAGDKLVLVPSYAAGNGFYPNREFVEFEMLSTAQGVVVRPKIDNLRVARLRDGMKITAPEGLVLTKNLPAIIADDSISAVEGNDNLFPYALWKSPEEQSGYHFANEIMGQIPLASPQQKQSLRLRLAQLNLAEERPLEALSLVELIRRESPDYYQINRLSALRGAANFLMHRYLEAAADFADPSLDNIAEIELWRDTAAILTTGEGKAAYLDYYKNFISKYPPYFAPRLGMVAADMLISRNMFNRALRIYETLNPALLRPSERGYMDYQMGRISAATNQHKQAIKIWEALAARPDNYIRSRAIFAMTNHLLRNAKISIPEAIKRLDQIRITWRGDDFELGLLRFVGDLYEANQQPREALRAYREIIQFFPDNPDNLALLGKMADMFLALFNGGMADKMSPLEALALYYEFRDLTPIGEAGDKMVRNLADRLVGVDLLDRAAALLEHQVRYRLGGEQRSRVGAQLALIQLFNRKPKQALQALELTGYGRNPEPLQQSRNILTARALADLGEDLRALRLLEDDYSTDANNLRIGIHWDNKDWKQVISAGEAIMGRRSDPTAKISEDESSVLLKLAIAYVFERQTEQVQYLRDYFLPLMKGNKNEHVFDFITRDAPVDYRNLAKLTTHLGDVESFLSAYRKKMEKEGLSKAIP